MIISSVTIEIMEIFMIFTNIFNSFQLMTAAAFIEEAYQRLNDIFAAAHFDHIDPGFFTDRFSFVMPGLGGFANLLTRPRLRALKMLFCHFQHLPGRR